MRALTIIGALLASTSFAQSGAWGGYVTGWQRAPPRLGTNFVNGYIGDTQVEPSDVTLPYVPTVYGWPAPLTFMTDEDVARQQEEARLRAQEAEAAQAELEQARARAEEAERVAEQQRQALEQQQLAQQQQQALMEAQARLAEEQAKAKQAELERRQAEESARAEEAARPPPEPGPEIHRWVDEEGVVHYSTNPPP